MKTNVSENIVVEKLGKMSIKANVHCEETDSYVTLWLSTEEYDRASVDNDYLRELLARHTAQVEEDERAAPPTAEEVPTPNENHASSLFIWNTSCVLLLLTLYEEYAESFNDSTMRHKKIWELISNKMKENDYVVTGLQCQTKLNGLKRTYKKIIDHNNKSGNDRASWPFFERMNQIFGKTGWAQPTALASEILAATESEPHGNDRAGSNSQETQKKKRKVDNSEKYFRELKEMKENIHKEKEQKKEIRFKKLIEMKERQHKEKLELLRQLLHNKN